MPQRKSSGEKGLKKLVILIVIGQFLFGIYTVFLKYFSASSLNEIKKQLDLDETPIPKHLTKIVSSANSYETMNVLKNQDAEVILVNGTRLISKNILECINTPFINTHAGITPKYRGVHGDYWALSNKDDINL